MNTGQRTPALKTTLKALSLVIAGLVAVLIQFRAQVANGFSVLYGDSYDAAIVVTIMEHWFNVARGASHWAELYYFYPYHNILAHTDGYFLVGVIYVVLKLLGLDPFITSELSNVVVRLIGFFAFYAMARRVFTLPHWWALLGALLFIISNNLTAHGQRLQLATVSFAPIMALLMWEAYRALDEKRKAALLGWGCGAGVFLGAWSITCFYITWFYIYFTTFFILASAVLNFSELGEIFRKIKNSMLQLGVIATVTAVSLIPLLSVYLPKSREVGMRTYESALAHTVPLHGIVETGDNNFLFGPLYSRILHFLDPAYVHNGEYYNTGISPILFCIFIAALLPIGSRRYPDYFSPRWVGLALAAVITWVGVINFNGYSAWYYLYSYFPGAKALNVVSAYQIFLSIPVIIIAMKYLTTAKASIPMGLVAVIVGLLVVEELNSGYIYLDRKAELAKVALPAPAPENCKAFYVSGWASQDGSQTARDSIANLYAHNVSAMLLAELMQLPTLNGIASFNPPDWNFSNPNFADYNQRIKAYVDSHHLSAICRFDLDSRHWTTGW